MRIGTLLVLVAIGLSACVPVPGAMPGALGMTPESCKTLNQMLIGGGATPEQAAAQAKAQGCP